MDQFYVQSYYIASFKYIHNAIEFPLVNQECEIHFLVC